MKITTKKGENKITIVKHVDTYIYSMTYEQAIQLRDKPASECKSICYRRCFLIEYPDNLYRGFLVLDNRNGEMEFKVFHGIKQALVYICDIDNIASELMR